MNEHCIFNQHGFQANGTQHRHIANALTYPTGHFALERFGDEISATIRNFLDRKVGITSKAGRRTEKV